MSQTNGFAASSWSVRQPPSFKNLDMFGSYSALGKITLWLLNFDYS